MAGLTPIAGTTIAGLPLGTTWAAEVDESSPLSDSPDALLSTADAAVESSPLSDATDAQLSAADAAGESSPASDAADAQLSAADAVGESSPASDDAEVSGATYDVSCAEALNPRDGSDGDTTTPAAGGGASYGPGFKPPWKEQPRPIEQEEKPRTWALETSHRQVLLTSSGSWSLTATHAQVAPLAAPARAAETPKPSGSWALEATHGQATL